MDALKALADGLGKGCLLGMVLGIGAESVFQVTSENARTVVWVSMVAGGALQVFADYLGHKKTSMLLSGL